MKEIVNGRQVETYNHHGTKVWVISDLKGKHRENCLCYLDCYYFRPGTPENCPIAQALYEFDVKHGVTTPMWECPAYWCATATIIGHDAPTVPTDMEV